MRAPHRKRPLRRTIDKNITQYELDALSEKVRYIGSPEHKIPRHLPGFQDPVPMLQFVTGVLLRTGQRFSNGWSVLFLPDV